MIHWDYDKYGDPSDTYRRYVEMVGEEAFETEVYTNAGGRHLLIALDILECLKQNKTLSELFPDKYPMEMPDIDADEE